MRALLFIGLLIASGCATPIPVRSVDTDRVEIDSLAQDLDGLDAFSHAWRAAYQDGDFDAMRDLYEPDAWLMTRDQPARKGVDEILAYFANSRQAGGKAVITFETETVEIDGDYAFKTALWWLDSPKAIGEPVRDSGRSLVIFKRGPADKWRLWRDIDNNTPDAAIKDKPE